MQRFINSATMLKLANFNRASKDFTSLANWDVDSPSLTSRIVVPTRSISLNSLTYFPDGIIGNPQTLKKLIVKLRCLEHQHLFEKSFIHKSTATFFCVRHRFGNSALPIIPRLSRMASSLSCSLTFFLLTLSAPVPLIECLTQNLHDRSRT